MSKLSQLQYFRYQPAAGGILGDILEIGKGIFGKKKTAPVTASPLMAIAPSPQSAAVKALTGGGGFGGAKRRGKGITAKELRGFRKVSRLLHKEGMVSKKARKG